MNTTDDLFELIKSMGKAEKRHFKLSSSSFGESQNYLRLYNAIEKQARNTSGTYDENAIIKIFKGEPFVKQLHVTKNYLYKHLMKSLKTFHIENSSRYLLRSILDDYEVLFEKKLYRQADKVLRRAKKMAEEYESFYYLLEVLDKEERALRMLNDVKTLEREFENIYKKRGEILKKIENGFAYKKISSEMLLISHREGVARKKETESRYKKIIARPMMKNPALAYTDTATGFYHQILSSCYFYTHNYKKTYYHLLQQKKFIESSAVRKKKFKGEYINVLGNMLEIGQGILNFERMQELLGSFKNIMKEFPNESERVLQAYYTISTNTFCTYGYFKEAYDVVKEAEGWIKETKIIRRADNSDLALRQKLAYACFGAEKYKEALEHLNIALSFPEKENIRTDIYPYLLTFNLILHYELRNNELLPYLTRSLFRFLTNKQKLFRFEKIILSFIRNTALTFNNTREQRAEFKKLKEELLPLIKNDFEKQPFNHFDFISWLDAKIEEISFAEAVKRNAKKVF